MAFQFLSIFSSLFIGVHPRRNLLRVCRQVWVGQCLNDRRGTGLVTCLLVNFGRAKIQVRRLSMSRGTETGDVDLKVDEVQ
jgi:hypothetical protein